MEFFVSSAFWSVISIWFGAVVMPGADMFLIIRSTVSAGRICGYFATFGIIVGTLVWLGVGFFFIHSLSQTPFFEVIQVLGGTYLVYMAWQIFGSLRSKSLAFDGEKASLTPQKSFIQGVLTNLANPKPPVFVSIILSKIPHMPPFEISLFLLFIMTLIPLLWFVVVVRVLSIERFFSVFMRFSKLLDGVVLCVFGIFGLSLILDGARDFLGV